MIVIAMAGRSQRFHDAGYALPKFALPLKEQTVFDFAVGSFASVFNRERFLFVTADAQATQFVTERCAALGIASPSLVTLDRPSGGQAESVSWGLQAAKADPQDSVTIFNIDTFRPGFRFPGPALMALDGWLDVFEGSGPNWSYIRPDPLSPDRVLETAEKRPLSTLCCTGLYHFARIGDFQVALDRERRNPLAPELYVAPLYNHLIGNGARIGYQVISRADVIFCGVPAEYEALLAEDRSAIGLISAVTSRP